MTAGFEPVRDVFAANFSDDVDVGAAFCAVVDGVVVVDLWGGWRDRGNREPWTSDTLVNVYSCTKGLAAVAVAALVEAGELDYDAPVRDVWPELSAASGGLSVSQLLSHQAGLCGVRAPLQVADLYDGNAMSRRLEREPPFWVPGTAAGYHAVTWGYLVGELVRRATGESLGQAFRRRVAGPLAADVHIGLASAEHSRVADLIGPNRARRGRDAGDAAAGRETGPQDDRPRSPLHAVALANPLIRPYADACSASWRRAEIAASNGHATARAIATIYGALARGGELGGARILRPETVAALSEEVWGMDDDLVLGSPMRRGRGVNLNTRGELGPTRAAFGHSGTGGSVGLADPERRIGAGYVMNQLWEGAGPKSRSGRLLSCLYRCLDVSGMP